MKDDHDLRRLTRACERHVKDLTMEKNWIHRLLDSCNIHLLISFDIFVNVGYPILKGLLEGKDIDETIEGIPGKRL